MSARWRMAGVGHYLRWPGAHDALSPTGASIRPFARFGLIDRTNFGSIDFMCRTDASIARWLVGRMAYVWGWPLVNWHNRRTTFAKAPVFSVSGGFLSIAPTAAIGHTRRIDRPTPRGSPRRSGT